LTINADESIIDVCSRYRNRRIERSHPSPCLCDLEQASMCRGIGVHVWGENIRCTRRRCRSGKRVNVRIAMRRGGPRLRYAGCAWLGLSTGRWRRSRGEYRRASSSLGISIRPCTHCTRPSRFLLCARTRFSSRGRLVADRIGARRRASAIVAHPHRSKPLSLYLDCALSFFVWDGSSATYPTPPFLGDITSLHDPKARSMTPSRADIACD